MSRAAAAALAWAALVVCGPTAPAGEHADWPTYRADAARSGYTPDELTETPALLWVYRAPHKPQPAWPDRHWQRMAFDFAYQPVVAGGALYYGGSADGKVHAIDAATGRPRWAFCTDGPVRFAPAIWRDRVFAASDDGWLYCLAASDGRCLWKLRGGPNDRKILGNGRMISMFPARGGLVVRELPPPAGTSAPRAVVYFGAGIFPTQGFFLHAVDARSGRVLWTNDTAGNRRRYQYNHGFTYGNVAAQGYLAIAGDVLLVSTGRATPAAFRLADGGFLHFNPLEAYRSGGSWLMAADRYCYNADMAFHVATGAVACPELGADPQAGLPANRSPFLRTVRMLSGAAAPELILVATGGAVRAIDRARPFVDDANVREKWCTSRTAAFFAGAPRTRLSQKLQGANVLWTAPLPCSGELIVAGARAVAGADGLVSALDLKSRKVTWTAKVAGCAYGLAVAGGRLYVSTDAGRIYCFGRRGGGAAPAGPAEPPAAGADEKPYGDNALYARAAEEIVRRTHVTEGYCLDHGCGDGRLAYELARRTRLHIYAVDGEARHVAAARKALTAAGLYGTRVTVHHLPPAATGYPAYFANLIVSGRSVTAGPADGAGGAAEVRRLQRPCGGAICVGRPGEMRLDVRGPLDGAGSWTHQCGGPANTCSSADTLARGPLAPLWFGTSGPGGMCPSKQRPAAPLYAAGRIYISAQRLLRCLDAYNGRVLWEAPLGHRASRNCYMGANLLCSHLCADAECVYFLDDRRRACLRLDGRTGKVLANLPAPPGPDGRPGNWAFVACADGLLYGTLASAKLDVGYSHYLARLGAKEEVLPGRYTEGCALFAMDPQTGKVRWTYRSEALIPPSGVAIGGGRVYLLDRPNLSVRRARLRRRGQAAPETTAAGAIVALDAKAGKVLYRHREDVFGTLLAVSVAHDALVMGMPIMRRGNVLTDLFTRLAVHRAPDGRRLWAADAQYHQRPLLVGRTVVVDPGGFDWKTGRKHIITDRPCAYDLLTGEPKTRANPVTGQAELWSFGRTEKCSGWTASANLLLFRTGTISYYDFLRREGVSDVGGVRPGCFINVFAAGGLVLAPDNFAGCTCNYLHRTSMAFQSLPQKEHWALFMGRPPRPGRLAHLALNVGAIGDRRDGRGVLWLAGPRPHMQVRAGVKVNIRALTLDGGAVALRLPGAPPGRDRRRRKPLSWPCGYSDTHRPDCLYQRNAATTPIAGTDVPWVYTSGARGAVELTVNVARMPKDTRYTLRLHFAELEGLPAGRRVFDVRVGGRVVLRDLDVAASAGPAAALVKELTARADGGSLRIALVAKKGVPILSGVEVVPRGGGLP